MPTGRGRADEPLISSTHERLISILARTTIPLMTSKVSLAHLPQITRPLFLIFISCASTAVTTFPPIATSSNIPTHKVTLSLQCHKASPLPISIGISQAMRLLRKTSNLGLSISLIVELATSYPRGFATYCTVSNTVRAIGIGGTASLFLSAKMSTFLAACPAADARNLVALTRSKDCLSFCYPPLKNSSTAPYTPSSLNALGGMESSTSAQPISTPKPLQITFHNRTLL